MLVHLQIRDFTLIEERELAFEPGLTALTGETGAGKSVLLEALALAIGERADADRVRAGAARAEVAATFDVTRLAEVRAQLEAADLPADECVLRRVVTAEGRSRAYVNGRSVSLSELRALGEQLIDLHSQHEHQMLLRPAAHRRLLDDYAGAAAAAESTAEAYTELARARERRTRASASLDDTNARFQLLSYQVDELDQLALSEGEVESLEARQRELANAEVIIRTCAQVAALCAEEDDSLSARLARAVNALGQLPTESPRVRDALEMLGNARIQVEEAAAELSRMADSIDADGADLTQVEARLDSVYELARKHRVAPADLWRHHQQLAAELAGLTSGDEQLEVLAAAEAAALARYQMAAAELSQLRAKAAKALGKAINGQLDKLAMARAKFEVALSPLAEPARGGAEAVEFMISTVPGQPARPLAKVASGGELSRIGLAIVVVTAKTSVTPTLVFDEVDVGIGGATGAVVGQMLRELGEAAQVLCVTHLAQVASRAHRHLRVEKSVTADGASTEILELTGDAKVREIARMMGGSTESKQSLAHARELLRQVP